MMELITFSPGISTKETAESIFRFLAVTDFEEHESLNYPPENGYFKGKVGSYEMSIYAVDDSETSTHRLSISSTSLIDEVFLKKLTQYLADLKWNPHREL